MNRRAEHANLPAARVDRGPDVLLQPGDYFVGGGTRVRTLLGSCVSIVLWHAQRRLGAMSHFVLASRGDSAAGSQLDARYGDEALVLMIRELELLRVAPAECEGKIFGGGDMFPSQSGRQVGAATVGQRNGEAARMLLEARGVGVRAQHLYGDGHRQVIFDVCTGHVWVRHVKTEPACGSRARRGR